MITRHANEFENTKRSHIIVSVGSLFQSRFSVGEVDKYNNCPAHNPIKTIDKGILLVTETLLFVPKNNLND